MGRLTLNGFFMLILLAVSPASNAWCWEAAGQKYGISPLLLQAVSWQESRFNARAVNNANRNGTSDIGLMQINSSHIPRLKELGVIRRKEDLFSPCLNIQVGAWILAQHFQQCGQNKNCLGSYNAGFSGAGQQARNVYANSVIHHWRAMKQLKRQSLQQLQ